jgi:hypothetical protein
MLVGCIKMQLVSIKVMVHLYVGILTLVTFLFVMSFICASVINHDITKVMGQ